MIDIMVDPDFSPSAAMALLMCDVLTGRLRAQTGLAGALPAGFMLKRQLQTVPEDV